MKPTTPASKLSSDSQGDPWLTTSGGVDDMAGVRLGRYELLFPLASGGMGAVYAGRVIGREGIGRLVAVKVMLNRNPGDADVQAFLSEASVTARLAHPNVVQTIELGEEQGSLFIAMELVRGQSLRKVLATLGRQKRHLPIAIIARIMIQAANGLHAAHELNDASGTPLNLIHRDLSPDNILLSYTGQVFVSDFGVAKLSNTASTHTGVVKGKFAYMSPEQVSAEPLDRRSDIFALGILLWEALTGRRLFKGGTPRETVALILRCSVKNPRELRSDVPDRLAEITLRCLEHPVQNRYATAQEVAEDLRDCVKEGGLTSDERDLAELLDTLFAKERAELSAKLDDTELAAKTRDRTQASGSGLLAGVLAASAAGEIPEATGGTLASAVSDVQSRPKLARVAVGVMLAAAVGASGVFVLLRTSEEPPRLRSVLGNSASFARTLQTPTGVTSAGTALEGTPSASAVPREASTAKPRPAPRPASKNPPAPGPKKRKDDLFENF